MQKTTDRGLIIYEGRTLGTYAHGHVTPEIDESPLLQLIQDLDIDDRVHLPTAHPGIHALARHYGITPADYLTRPELKITSVHRGCTSTRDARKKDGRLAYLAESMHVHLPRLRRLAAV